MPAPFDPPPELRRLARLALLIVPLLGADIVLAWMVLQGAYVFLGLVWHALARELLPPGSLEAHGSQFRTVRIVQAVAWLATIAAFAAWLSLVRRHRERLAATSSSAPPGLGVAPPTAPDVGSFRVAPTPGKRRHAGEAAPQGRSGVLRHTREVAWWLAAIVTAALGETAAAVLAGGAGTPLDLGGAMQVLILAQLAEIAAAILTIALIRRVNLREEDRVRSLAGHA
jgi:hypothetical protein